jgi:hypothetical protein
MAKQAKQVKRKGDEYFAKYPHFVAGSIVWDATKNKQRARCKCACGTEYECFTSDLFQLKTCADCRKKTKKIKEETKEETKTKKEVKKETKKDKK